MKIIYDRNPLNVKIYLDDKEKEIFKWKYIAKRLEDNILFIKFFLTDTRGISVDKALEFCKEIQSYEKSIEYLIDSLTYPHDGDCVAFACSCEKCWAEDILEINTAPPSKTIGSAISAAFRELQNNNITENETEAVLAILKSHELKYKEFSHVVKYFEEYSIKHSYLLV